MYVVRKIGTDEYWDGVCFGERRRAKLYATIMTALAAKCGPVITEVEAA